MYQERSHKDLSTHAFLGRSWKGEPDPGDTGLGLKIHTVVGETNLLSSHTGVSLTDEQRISASLASPEDGTDSSSTAHEVIDILPRSVPIASPAPSTATSATNVSSPAMMFLSAFSPSVPRAVSPDAEGEYVSGYRLGKVIGHGGFSVIREASSQAGGLVAVKIVRRADLHKQPNSTLAHKRMDHETTVWSSLNHEHVLPLFSVERTAFADYFFTILCPAGSLYDILKNEGTPALPHDDVGMMFRQIVRGLRYLHETAEIVHRDMKLENVLIDEMGGCRIGDFGMSRKIGDLPDDDDDELEEESAQSLMAGVHRAATLANRKVVRPGLPTYHASLKRPSGMRSRAATNQTLSHHHCQPGSLPYAAVELLSGSPRPVHPAQDIWALGIMLHVLLTGHYPFNDSFEPRLQFKILNTPYELPSHLGLGAERVLNGCIDKNMHTRWTIAAVDDASWGVGWGIEGDEAVTSSTAVTPSVDGPVDILYAGPPSRSRSSNRETSASRRSLSRSKRSLSRAPLDRSHRPALHISASYPPNFADISRGRSLTKDRSAESRSASPSEAPKTPIDSATSLQSVRLATILDDDASLTQSPLEKELALLQSSRQIARTGSNPTYARESLITATRSHSAVNDHRL